MKTALHKHFVTFSSSVSFTVNIGSSNNKKETVGANRTANIRKIKGIGEVKMFSYNNTSVCKGM